MNEKNETNERSISSSQILRFVQKKRTEIYYELQSRNIDLYGYDQNRSVLISVTQLQPNFNTYTYIHTARCRRSGECEHKYSQSASQPAPRARVRARANTYILKY